jgi:hypothetical protein
MTDYLRTTIIPRFHSVFGYSDQLYMGYPVVHIYPTGLFFIASLLSLVGLSSVISWKIILFTSLLMVGFFPFYGVYRIYSMIPGATLSLFWFWLAMNFFWQNIVQYGMIPYFIAVQIAIFYIFYVDILDFSTGLPFLSKSQIIATFLLFFSVFINFMAIIFLGIVYTLKILLLFSQYKKKAAICRNILKFFSMNIIGAIFLYAFWLFPTIFIQFQYVEFNYDSEIFSHQNSIEQTIIYFKNNAIVIGSIGLIFIILILLKKIKRDNSIVQIFLISFAVPLILPFLNIPFISGINTYRFLIFFEFSSAVILGIFTNIVIKSILAKRNHPKIRLFSKNQMQLIGEIILIGMSFVQLTPIFPFSSNIRGGLFNEQNSPDGQILCNDEISDWGPDEKMLYQWILNNTDKESRILLQNSGENYKFRFGPGHGLSYFAYLTDRYYATGDLDHFWYNNSQKSMFINDILFGKNLVDYNYTQLELYFKMYNIEYIIVWSNTAVNFFDETCVSTTDLIYIGSLNSYHIYRYERTSRSFVISSDPDIIVLKIKNLPEYKQFLLQNISGPLEITYSLHDFPNWHIYVNGIEIQKSLHALNLIHFKLPEQIESNVIITIIWEKEPIEVFFYWISFLSAIFFLLALVWTMVHSRIKKIGAIRNE